MTKIKPETLYPMFSCRLSKEVQEQLKTAKSKSEKSWNKFIKDLLIKKGQQMNYRHGDLALISVDKLPENLAVANTKVILSNGSGGHAHSITQGELYLVDHDPKIVGYLKAKATQLLHPEHGDVEMGGVKTADIEDGLYQIIRQQEETHEGMTPVID